MTAEAFRVPIALISLILENKQWFKAYFGLPADAERARGTPREWAFCRHVVQAREPLIVPDARTHPYFSTNPAVKAGLVGSYAGAPLVTPRGDVLGTLCIVDSKPLAIGPGEVQNLALLARRAAGELEMRSATWRRSASASTLSTSARSTSARDDTTEIMPAPWSHADLETALSNIDSAVLLLDAHRRVLFGSPAFSDIFERPVRCEAGMSRDEFLRQIAGYFGKPEEFLRRLSVDQSGPYSGREICRAVTPRPKVVRWIARPVPRGTSFAQLESFTDISGDR
jgi:PAS domain-containing protein